MHSNRPFSPFLNADLARGRSHAGERGVALVITLSMLLITTIIIVAFFSRAGYDQQATASYSSSVQSDLLATGAMDQVVGNFLQEIEAGSTPKTSNGFTWYEPTVASSIYPTMVPFVAVETSLKGTAPARNNLVKQSRQGIPFSATGPDIASDVFTDKASLNNRSVTAARWDLPKLLLDPTGTSSANFAAKQIPQWIYVKSNGEATSNATDASKIVGRYAYNVYDVGGLLNINVAGHKSGVQPEDVGAKGSAALADLTVIPGLDTASVDTILDWRAPRVSWNTWLPSGKTEYDSIPIGGNLPLQNYLQVGAVSGWLRNPSTSTTPQGNQFFSRRDLIKYFADKGLSPAALPFLTHFSVDADAPSFSPDTDTLKVKSGQIIESASGSSDIATIQKTVNPARYANIASVPLPNGKTEAAPVLHKRFPLSRLALVATDPVARGAAGSSPALTKKYFGLVPVDDYTWTYTDAEGGIDHIKDLSEIPATREPNFFEILKSVIQVGSLGQYKNQKMVTVPYGAGGAMEPRADRIDEQVIRIGAAIIDQADRDSFPTRIQFNYDDATKFGEIYGVEDLPYLYAMRFVAYAAPTSTAARPLKVIIAQPSLWNPHNPNRSNVSVSGNPGGFQVVAKSFDTNDPVRLLGDGWDSIPVYAHFDGVSQKIGFSWNSTSSVFRQPQALLSTAYPLTLTHVQTGPFPVAGHEDHPYGTLAPFSRGGGAVGFLIAQNITPPTGNRFAQQCKYNSGSIQFLLQYTVGSNSYTYDHLWFYPFSMHFEHNGGAVAYDNFSAFEAGNEEVDLLATGDPGGAGTGAYNTVRVDAVVMKTDPRSQRFMWPSDIVRFFAYHSNDGHYTPYETYEGTGLGYFGGIYTNSFYALGGPAAQLCNPMWTAPKDPRMESSNDSFFRTDLGYVSINDKTKYSSLYYADPDDVRRRAMGGLGTYSGAPPSGGRTDVPVPPTTRSVGLPMQNLPLWSSQDSSAEAQIYKNRPIVLNRPFRSVGELAYAFRDVPWKNVDFTFPESGDTGLLDAFTVYENEGQADSATPLVAGKVNLNVAPLPVITALLNGAAKENKTNPSSSMVALTNGQISTLAARILSYRDTGAKPSELLTDPSNGNGPLRSLAELVGRVYSSAKGNFSDQASFVGLHPEKDQPAAADDGVMTERLSSLPRALADVGTVRTWNFMIDLVAQSGNVKEGGALNQFNVASESRWWMFVSIDRFTGKILARSVERVIE